MSYKLALFVFTSFLFMKTGNLFSQALVDIEFNAYYKISANEWEIYFTKKDSLANYILLNPKVIASSVNITKEFVGKDSINIFLIQENSIYLFKNLAIPSNISRIELGIDTLINKQLEVFIDSFGVSRPVLYFYVIISTEDGIPRRYTQLINKNFQYDICDRIKFILNPELLLMFEKPRK